MIALEKKVTYNKDKLNRIYFKNSSSNNKKRFNLIQKSLVIHERNTKEISTYHDGDFIHDKTY